ncbi:MAG: YdcF family protein [Clostridia bacterium]|nr:YdcF family protein [Clostridia bacterium]
MGAILENIRVLWPILAAVWAFVIGMTVWKPQRYCNSIFLMAACFVTMLFVSGLFGERMGYALLGCFLLVMVLLFLVPLMLIINGVQLLKKESFSFPHLLSLLLGIGVGIGEVAAVVFVLGFARDAGMIRVHFIALGLSATVFYFSCLVLNFVLYSVFIGLLPHVMKFEYIIIHGCGLAGGERVTKLLAGRVDKAVRIYHKCRKKPILIPSGGQGADERISEAEAMRRYLLEQGIPEEHILMEDRSSTTMENLRNSKAIIDSRPGGRRTALVSSNYHIYRCLGYAKQVGLNCVGIGAKVAFYYWPSALIREFMAVFLTKKFLVWSLAGYLVFMLPLLFIGLQI